MRTFVIADASKRKAKPIGILLWESDPLNGQGRFSLELDSRCTESDLPLSLSFLAKREDRTALPEESEDWVRSRIVPEDRHNIVEVLIANGLAEYDEVSLLAASMGRSSDDDLLVYEVDIPDETVFTRESRANRIIAAVERRRDESKVFYAYVGFPETESTPGAAPRPSGKLPRRNCAQTIGEHIRNRRTSAGLTQQQLATGAGITQSVLSRIESGKGNPTLSLLEEIAAALGTNIDISLASQAETPE